MEFKKKDGGLALISKKRGILGWVMTTIDWQFTFDVSRKETKCKRELFDNEEEAKTALMKEI